MIYELCTRSFILLIWFTCTCTLSVGLVVSRSSVSLSFDLCCDVPLPPAFCLDWFVSLHRRWLSPSCGEIRELHSCQQILHNTVHRVAGHDQLPTWVWLPHVPCPPGIYQVRSSTLQFPATCAHSRGDRASIVMAGWPSACAMRREQLLRHPHGLGWKNSLPIWHRKSRNGNDRQSHWSTGTGSPQSIPHFKFSWLATHSIRTYHTISLLCSA